MHRDHLIAVSTLGRTFLTFSLVLLLSAPATAQVASGSGESGLFNCGVFGSGRQKSHILSPGEAGVYLRDIQIESCRYGLNGRFLWTWDGNVLEDAWDASWMGLEEGGAINRQRAPIARPDPCSP